MLTILAPFIYITTCIPLVLFADDIIISNHRHIIKFVKK